MKVLTPHDDVVDASEVEAPEAFPKIAVIERDHASFAISEGSARPDAWDNPNLRPFSLYEIDAPGKRGASARTRLRWEAHARRLAVWRHAGTYTLSRGMLTRLEDWPVHVAFEPPAEGASGA
jgi:hypothetical protein